MIAVDEIAPLAHGGTAELFGGRAGGARVVLKLAREDRPWSASALAAEAAMLERLGGCHAPRLLGRTRWRDRDALVLEHVDLPTLGSALPRIADRGAVARAMCDAVAAIHREGVVHADLTPSNILVEPASALVRLIDFGLAAPIGEELAPLATIGYAAPERLGARCRAEPAIDVYALGVICYEMFTGAPPFDGAPGARRVAHAAHRVPRIAERVAVSSAIDDAIARAMAKAPARRPVDAGALRALLDGAAPSRVACEPVLGSARPQRAVLVAFRWVAGAATVRDAITSAGAVVAYSDPSRHVAALWSGEARVRAERLTRMLEQAGATELDIVEATLHIAPNGQPRGAAIVELGRRRHAAGAPARTPALAPLVGRDEPLAAVDAFARRRGSALVTIWGAPGMGKSRLAAAIAERLDVVELRAPSLDAMIDRFGATRGDVANADRAALASIAGRGTLAGSAAEHLAPAPGALRQAAARALAAAIAGAGARTIVVDDAHAADPIVLDALELATMDDARPLLVIALARPALAITRPRWGRRAAHGEALTLAPLDRDAGRGLVRALLPAVAAVPAAVIDRLVERCGGVPLYVTELVGALRRAEPTRGTRGALPTVELPTDHGIVAWAIADELSGLAAGAVAAAEALAVIARDVALAELATVFEALDAGGVRIELDAGVAISDLVSAGVLVEAAGALRFRHDLVRDAIALRADPARRTAIHRAMLARSTSPAERARHAEGAGDREAAAKAWRAAARAALARHDDLAAETALEHALACLDVPCPDLLRVRGGARSRLGRHDAASGDFAAARELAQRAGDRGLQIDALLDEATALDWCQHYAASAARANEAALLAGDEPAITTVRRARLAMAAGRTAWRAGDGERAIEPCRAAIALADEVGPDGYETAIACRLMLGYVLGTRGDIDESARVLDEAVRDATARGDVMHAAAARGNRYPVHAARGDASALRADLAALEAAGRELGIAVTEYRGAVYQALVALWCDDDGAALVHARAARRLEEADPALFPRARGALLLGEVAARAGDAAGAAAWCDIARPHANASAVDAVMLDGLDAWVGGRLELAPATELAARAIAIGESEAAFELLELTARTAARAGDAAGASAAHRAARTLPPALPRFIAGIELS